MRNVLFVISGPSGVGKGTLVDLLLKNDSALALSVSCTTRQPRDGERQGVDYFFLTREEFEKRMAEGDFLESDEHFGNYYGTPKSFVAEQLKSKSVVLEIDVVGALNARNAFQDGTVPVVLIMIAPPDLNVLKERLRGRQSESEEELARRVARAEYELSQSDCYDYVVVNGDLQTAYSELKSILQKERNKE